MVSESENNMMIKQALVCEIQKLTLQSMNHVILNVVLQKNQDVGTLFCYTHLTHHTCIQWFI